MNFCTKTTYPSELPDFKGSPAEAIGTANEIPAVPGVTYTLHKMSEYRRIQRELSIADLRVKFQERAKTADDTRAHFLALLDAAKAKSAAAAPQAILPILPDTSSPAPLATAEIKEEPVDPILQEAASASQTARLAWEQLLRMDWKPAWIRWGLVSIEGFVLDDRAGTIDDLLGPDGPDQLIDEIFLKILDVSGLGAQRSGNLPGPGPSEDQADGKTSSSIASNAAPPNGTATATAPSISPAT
jgi:hypothetical protein